MSVVDIGEKGGSLLVVEGIDQTSASLRPLYADYELPDYTSVAGEPTFAFIESKQLHNGTIYRDYWSMNDEVGTECRATRALSSAPNSSVWVIRGTPLGTQPAGFSDDVSDALMGKGFNVLTIGPEINSSLEQSQSAFNVHLMLDALEETGELNAKVIALEGYSRSSMIDFGVVAYAARFNRHVVYSNFTDPCLAKPLGPNVETIKKAASFSLDFSLLMLDVARSVAANPRRAKNWAATVDLSANGARQLVRTAVPLFSGEAGMLAASTPEDMKGTVAFFRRCTWNDAATFRQILQDRPGVRFVRPEGGHGGGLRNRVIGNIATRFGRLGEELADGRQPDEIDYRYVLKGLKLVK